MARRSFTRREFLTTAGKASVVAGAAASLPAQLLAPTRAAGAAVLSKRRRRTLHAAVARIVPATSPGDWSAADVGADEYVLGLLTGASRIYAGGPTRKRFERPRTRRCAQPKRADVRA